MLQYGTLVECNLWAFISLFANCRGSRISVVNFDCCVQRKALKHSPRAWKSTKQQTWWYGIFLTTIWDLNILDCGCGMHTTLRYIGQTTQVPGRVKWTNPKKAKQKNLFLSRSFSRHLLPSPYQRRGKWWKKRGKQERRIGQLRPGAAAGLDKGGGGATASQSPLLHTPTGTDSLKVS